MYFSGFFKTFPKQYVCRNVLAAATPYFHAMFTSGLIESEFQGRWTRGRSAAGPNHRQKSRQKLVLQGIKPKILEVNKHNREM